MSVAGNLTSSEDGLASYGDAEVAAMITGGVKPDGTRLLPPMPYAAPARTTEEDLAAVIAGLRRLPPLPDRG